MIRTTELWRSRCYEERTYCIFPKKVFLIEKGNLINLTNKKIEIPWKNLETAYLILEVQYKIGGLIGNENDMATEGIEFPPQLLCHGTISNRLCKCYVILVKLLDFFF
uniref:Uncharacterized protein n=1 Tax=Cacopsylla melanoneura TaxID=428564 RepID=A0A8D9BNE2_9HEMI